MSSTDPAFFRAYGVQPAQNWPEILALHNHALYSELELMELYNAYRQKGSDGGFKEFVESRFVAHPYFTDKKYMWRTDYQRAVERLRAEREKVSSLSPSLIKRKTS